MWMVTTTKLLLVLTGQRPLVISVYTRHRLAEILNLYLYLINGVVLVYQLQSEQNRVIALFITNRWRGEANSSSTFPNNSNYFDTDDTDPVHGKTS